MDDGRYVPNVALNSGRRALDQFSLPGYGKLVSEIATTAGIIRTFVAIRVPNAQLAGIEIWASMATVIVAAPGAAFE